jgi:LysM repeat protein
MSPESSSDSTELTGLARVWAEISAIGWREAILRYASHALILLLLLGAIWAGQTKLGLIERLLAKVSLNVTSVVTPQETTGLGITTQLTVADSVQVSRLADVHTLIPTRGRSTVITYTVEKGDTLFGIAENFGLKPETVLWGNYNVLKDNPHVLYPDQALNILPVDGTYHYVTEGNTIEQIAKFYGVTPREVIDWPGNNLDPDKPVLTPNTWLVIPGGQRELKSWEVPQILRSTRVGGAASNNFGQCPGGYTGAVGVGAFVWPADNHSLSGYDFSAIHHGLDIRARQGNSIYATDGGVVVYAGWNDFGYGNLVVIDHGNGWQSVYGHLSQWNVTCGQSVFQGNLIGLAGNTGRSSGAHLHFELRYNGAYVNPWTVLLP